MANVIAHGTITAPATGVTGSQTYTITGFGVAPKLVIFYGGLFTSHAFASGDVKYFGAMTASAQFSTQSISAGGGGGTSVANRYDTDAKAICFKNTLGTLLMEAEYQGFGVSGSDGTFSLNWTDVTSGGRVLNYIAFGGDLIPAIARVAIPSSVSGGTPTAHAHGNSGTPTCAIICSVLGDTSTGLYSSNHAPFVLGWSDGTNQRTMGTWAANGQPTTRTNRVQTAKIFDSVIDTGSGPSRWVVGSLTSIDATNVNINWTDVAGSRYANMITLSGIDCEVGAFNGPATSGSTTDTVATALSTLQGLLVSSNLAPTDAAILDEAAFNLGGSDGTNQGALASRDDDALGSPDNARWSQSSYLIDARNLSDSVQTRATVAFDAGDIDLTYSNADGNAREYNYLAFGSAGGTPAAITPNLLDLALPNLSSSFRLSASISPLSFDLTLPNLSATFNQAGAISPLSLDLTMPSISAAFRQSASLTPLNLDLAFTELVGSTTSGESLTVLGLDLALPEMSSSFKQAASISPLSLDLTQPAMFAAHHTGAELDPLSFDLALPEMSAGFQQGAAIAPLVLDFNLPDLSATGGTSELLAITQLEFVLPTMLAVHRESAQISPLALTLAQPEHFSGHHVTADLGALSLDLAMPAITSTFRLDAAITPLAMEFTQPAVTSGYRLAAAITPLALEFTQPAISATQAFVVTLDPLGFELALPDLSESHSLRADIGPLLFELALPVMIGVSPSFTLGQLAVLEGASLQIVTLAGASMETAVLNGT